MNGTWSYSWHTELYALQSPVHIQQKTVLRTNPALTSEISTGVSDWPFIFVWLPGVWWAWELAQHLPLAQKMGETPQQAPGESSRCEQASPTCAFGIFLSLCQSVPQDGGGGALQQSQNGIPKSKTSQAFSWWFEMNPMWLILPTYVQEL